MTVMDHWLKAALEITAAVEIKDEMSAGYINTGRSYETSRGKIFVKYNDKPQVRSTAYHTVYSYRGPPINQSSCRLINP